MKERSSNETNVMETWTTLAENTMAGYPATTIIEALAQAQQPRQENPWVSLIDPLWHANPLSKVVPIAHLLPRPGAERPGFAFLATQRPLCI